MRHKIGCGRRDEDEVSPAGQLDVTHGSLGCRVPQVTAHRPARHRLKRHRRDELAGPGRHDDLDLGALFYQPPDQIRAFVGGDATRHAQHDAFTVHHFIMVSVHTRFP